MNADAKRLVKRKEKEKEDLIEQILAYKKKAGRESPSPTTKRNMIEDL